jgi:hypothetical protein
MRFAAAVALVLLVAQAHADDFEQFTHGRPITLREDRAYLFFRGLYHEDGRGTPTAVLVRELTADEMGAAGQAHDKHGRYTEQEPNVLGFDGDNEYTHEGDEWTYVVAVKPGTYIVAGVGFTSLCLGTVKFDAKPGVITDLGYILIARNREKTPAPELQDVVARIRRDQFMPFVLAVRPFVEGMPVPVAIANLPKVSADYHVVRSFPNYFHTLVDRIVPMPGLIDYDSEGHAIDLKATPHVNDSELSSPNR